MFGETEGNAGPLALCLGGGDHHPFADDAFHQSLTGTDHLWSQNGESSVKLAVSLFRQIDAISGHTREGDFQHGTLLDGGNARGFLGRLDRSDLGFGCEVKGNAHDVGIFNIEQVIAVQLIGIAAQAPPDDLLTKKLSAKRADAEDMRHRIGVPTFRQHGNRDDATHLFA